VTDGPLRVSLRLAACLAVVALYCAKVCGDETTSDSPIREVVVLKNGDRVSGTSLDVEHGSLRWRMPYGAEIALPLALVERIEQLSEDEAADHAAATVSAELPPVPPPLPSPSDTPPILAPIEEAPASQAEAAVTPADEPLPNVLRDPLPLSTAWYEASRSTYHYAANQTGLWTKRIELGGSRVDGNSETTEVYIGGLFERQFDQVFHSLDWNGRQTSANGNVTQSRWQINGTTDFSKNAQGKWILFLTHRHLFDRLADLNYRGTYAGGIGYRFINEGDKRLIARLGPGMTIEKFDPPLNSRFTPDMFAEAEAKWPVLDRTLLEYKSTFSPSLNEIGVFRMTSTDGVLVKLDDKETWSMKAGLLHYYNSQPNPGKLRNDFTTTFSVVYTRK
jgi:putative salt-induced outer membrane protein YdiY